MLDPGARALYEGMELLRFTTAGSVDDGKSTLIGRLLVDTKGVFEDQMEALRRTTSRKGGEEVDLALLTDGLAAEREQGITIDVAYRYFATAKRKFIIADTPGHEQYTRNMVTGASTANLAIILVDARNGVATQSRRHGALATLLGIPHLVVAVNKMDLVDFSREVFDRIVADYRAFASKIQPRDLTFIPISALHGDNVVSRSPRTPWYGGPSLLEHLETPHRPRPEPGGSPFPGPARPASQPRLSRLRGQGGLRHRKARGPGRGPSLRPGDHRAGGGRLGRRAPGGVPSPLRDPAARRRDRPFPRGYDLPPP
jgi:sulfate adenylyltransferase large subunit